MSGRALLPLALACLAAGCTMSNPRPVYQATTSVAEGSRMLVVGVDREGANRAVVDGLAREMAFALSQRGRPAIDLTHFAGAVDALGRALPELLRERLLTGVVDATTTSYLQSEGVQTLIFLDVQIYDQVWAASGKRTRVGLAARGRDLADGESTWRAYSAPDVEDEPGRGFQLATESALGALVRVISGELEPVPVPGVVRPAINGIKRW